MEDVLLTEDRGPIRHHDGGPGRAGEAGCPGQPVVGGGQVLVLVLVLVGHEQAVEPLGGHGGADAGQVEGPVGRIGGFFEALAHGRYLGPTCGARKVPADRRRHVA